MKVGAVGGHVGESRQAVGVQVLVPHLQHVVLDRSAQKLDMLISNIDYFCMKKKHSVLHSNDIIYFSQLF